MAEGAAADEESFLLESTVRGHHEFGRQQLLQVQAETAHAINLRTDLGWAPIWAGHETGTTTPTNVRCDLYSGKNGAFGAPPDLTSKKRCYYCDLYSGKYGRSISSW